MDKKVYIIEVSVKVLTLSRLGEQETEGKCVSLPFLQKIFSNKNIYS